MALPARYHTAMPTATVGLRALLGLTLLALALAGPEDLRLK